MTESDLVKLIQVKATENGARLFRNNVGVGKSVAGSTIKFGLHTGSGDLIGWTPVKITDEMIGKTIAVFTSIECKSSKGRIRPDQMLWKLTVKEAGGISAIVKSENEFLEAIKNG